MTLPDIGMVHGRMLVTAWDFGVENVDDTAVRALMSAVEVSYYRHLKSYFLYGLYLHEKLPFLVCYIKNGHLQKKVILHKTQ